MSAITPLVIKKHEQEPGRGFGCTLQEMTVVLGLGQLMSLCLNLFTSDLFFLFLRVQKLLQNVILPLQY